MKLPQVAEHLLVPEEEMVVGMGTQLALESWESEEKQLWMDPKVSHLDLLRPSLRN